MLVMDNLYSSTTVPFCLTGQFSVAVTNYNWVLQRFPYENTLGVETVFTTSVAKEPLG